MPTAVAVLPQLALGVLVPVQVHRAVQDPLIGQLSSGLVRANLLSSALVGANLFLPGLIAYLIWTGWPQYRKVLGVAGAFVLLGGFVAATATFSRQWHRQFANFYDVEMSTEVYRFLEKHKPAEIRVAPFFYRIYPLFGSRRQSHVSQPLVVPSYDWLLRYLNEQQITFLATATGPQVLNDRYDKGRRWALQYPAEFTLAKESYHLLLFRFQPLDSRH
ncbi:MAG: hypothetical protein HY000_04435 [Planctomycetes bacterium]|nr:hypothetical protein [Planctomycetota bacterium]